MFGVFDNNTIDKSVAMYRGRRSYGIVGGSLKIWNGKARETSGSNRVERGRPTQSKQHKRTNSHSLRDGHQRERS